MRFFKSLPMKALSPCPVRRSFAVWDYNGNGDRHNRTECAVTLKVFISYKSEYRPFARALQTHLKDWGYPTWLDVDNIRPGEYFRHKIQQGLDTSDALVVVLTEEAQQSREVMAEVDYFLAQQNKPVVPLRHQDCKPLYIFVSIQYIDFVNNEVNGFEALRARLDELNAQQQGAASLPEAPKEPSPEASKEAESNAAPPPPPPVQQPVVPPPPQPVAPQRQSTTPLSDILVMPPAQAPSRRKSASPLRTLSLVAVFAALAIVALPLLFNAGNPPVTPTSTPPTIGTQVPTETPLWSLEGLAQNAGIIIPALIAVIAALVLLLTFLMRRWSAKSAYTLADQSLLKPEPVPGGATNTIEEQDLPTDTATGTIEKQDPFSDWQTLPVSGVLRHTDYGEYPLAGKPLAQVFDDLLGQMLLLGSAAARGRAWEELDSALRTRSAADHSRPFPLRLQAQDFSGSFEAWVAAEATRSAISAELVADDRLALLLDGVDALSPADGAACLNALQAYRHPHPKVDVVVGGTTADFDSLTHMLDIRGAVLLD